MYVCLCLYTHDRSRLRQLDTTAVHLLQKVREGLKRSQGYSGSRAEEGNDIEVIASKYKNGIPPEVCFNSTSIQFYFVLSSGIVFCFSLLTLFEFIYLVTLLNYFTPSSITLFFPPCPLPPSSLPFTSPHSPYFTYKHTSRC